MDIQSYFDGAAGEPPGAYLVGTDGSHNPLERNGIAPGGAASDETQRVAEDTYTATGKQAVGEAATELPDAVRGQAEPGASMTCYCGHCAACRAQQAEKGADQAESNRERVEESAQEPRVAAGEQDEPEALKAAPHELSDEEQRQVESLRQRDQEVRAHEQAHAAAGASNVRYDFQMGPDGRQYAVGGSADIQIVAMSDDHVSRVAQARQMRAAALAPAAPSAQDMAVAARAARLEAEALADKASEANEKLDAESVETGLALASGNRIESPANHESFFALA